MIFPCVCQMETLGMKGLISNVKFCMSKMYSITNEGNYPTVTRQLGEFLYNRIEHVEYNLFVQYYVRMANFNKVIKLLKFKSAANLQCFQMGSATERQTEDFATKCALSIAPPIGNNANSLQI